MRKTPGAALAGLLVIAAVVRADDAKKAADLRAIFARMDEIH